MNVESAVIAAITGKKTRLLTPDMVKEQKQYWWPRLEQILVKHTRGERRVEHVYKELLSGESQMCITLSNSQQVKGCAITRIEAYPLVKRLVFDFMFGSKLRGHVHEIEVIEKWAKAMGCTETLAYCRPGLAKLLTEDVGFKRAYDVVVREIKC